jgi:hypothetical protein
MVFDFSIHESLTVSIFQSLDKSYFLKQCSCFSWQCELTSDRSVRFILWSKSAQKQAALEVNIGCANVLPICIVKVAQLWIFRQHIRVIWHLSSYINSKAQSGAITMRLDWSRNAEQTGQWDL